MAIRFDSGDPDYKSTFCEICGKEIPGDDDAWYDPDLESRNGQHAVVLCSKECLTLYTLGA